MKNGKKLLLILLIIIFALVIFLYIIISISKKSTKENMTDNINEQNEQTENISNISNELLTNTISQDNNNTITIQSSFQNANMDNSIYNIIECIDRFNMKLSYLYKEKNESIEEESDIDMNESTLNTLDTTYTNAKNITKENVSDLATGEYTFIPTNTYSRNMKKDKIYIITGYRINKGKSKYEDYGYLVRIDKNNQCYSIIPYDYFEELSIIDRVQFSNPKVDDIDISKNDSNSFSEMTFDDKTIAIQYLSWFKTNCKYRPESAYSTLSSDYIKKLGDIDNFKNYLSKNQDKINSLVIQSVTKQVIGDKYTFSCKDSNGNDFVITVDGNNALGYSIQLSNIIL